MTLTEQNGHSEFIAKLFMWTLGSIVAAFVAALVWAGTSRAIAAIGETFGRFLK